MFLVRTAITSLGTPHAGDALAHFKKMEQSGTAATVIAIGGKALTAADLERFVVPHPVVVDRRRLP